MMMREKIIDQCLQVMKRDDVKRELKQLFHPVIDLIMQEIYPYIYLSVIFVLISFLLTLGIFVLLMRTSFLHNHIVHVGGHINPLVWWSVGHINPLVWCCAWHHRLDPYSFSQNFYKLWWHEVSWLAIDPATTCWKKPLDCSLCWRHRKSWMSLKWQFQKVSKMMRMPV